MLNKYIKPTMQEISDLFFINIILGLMFSITFMRFEEEYTFFQSFIIFFIFMMILMTLRQIFIKYIAYRNGFEMELYMTYFDRWGFKNYERFSYYSKKYLKTKRVGVPMPMVTFVLFILTAGIVIYPGVFRYELKKIAHKYVGTKSKFESELYLGITNYRYTKAIFSGYVFYFLAAVLVKYLGKETFGELSMWFLFVIFWMAFTSIIPIIGTEGYELLLKGRFAWVSSIIVLIVGLLGLIIFNNVLAILLMVGFVALITLLVWIYNDLMK